MPTDRAPADGEPAAREDPKAPCAAAWRSWLPFVVKPLRRGILIFALVLIIEYLVRARAARGQQGPEPAIGRTPPG